MPSKMYNHFVLGSNPTVTGEEFYILFDILNLYFYKFRSTPGSISDEIGRAL